MPQVVMRDPIGADFVARTIKRFLTFANAEHFRVNWFCRTVATHSLKQCARVWDQRDAAHRPILRRRFGVETDDDFASSKVNVAPCDLPSFDECFAAGQRANGHDR